MIHECPKCGEQMEYQPEDYDVGLVAGWSCDCGHTELAELDTSDWERD